MSDFFEEMYTLACEVRDNAYVPYLDFKVGVCIRTANNKLFTGCNFQNSALPLGLCAEPAAISSMITAGEREIIEVVVAASSKQPCMPCGGCRQQLLEFSKPTTIIHCCSISGECKTMTMQDLLPASFSANTLGK